MSKGFRVTVEDLDTGDLATRVIAPGDYILMPFEPCHLDSIQHYGNGTVQLTIKDHRPAAIENPEA